MKKVIVSLTVLAFIAAVLTAAYAQTNQTNQKYKSGTNQSSYGAGPTHPNTVTKTPGATSKKMGSMTKQPKTTGGTKAAPGTKTTMGKKTSAACPPSSTTKKAYRITHKRIYHKKRAAVVCTPAKRAGAGPSIQKKYMHYQGRTWMCVPSKRYAKGPSVQRKHYRTYRKYSRSYKARAGAGPSCARTYRTSTGWSSKYHRRSAKSYSYSRRYGAGPTMHGKYMYYKGRTWMCVPSKRYAKGPSTYHKHYRMYKKYSRARRAGAGAGAPCPTMGGGTSGTSSGTTSGSY